MKILKYFLFVVFLFLTLAAFGSGVIGSIIPFTILTLLFFPNLNDKLKEQGVPMPSKGARYIFYSLLFFVGFLFMSKDKESKSYILKPDKQTTNSIDVKPILNTIEKKVANSETKPIHITLNETTKNSNIINGLEPTDIIANFERIGFETERSLHSEFSEINQNLTADGIEYNVTTYFENGGVTDVTAVEFHATRMNPEFNSTEDMKKFLKLGCTINYEGANTEKAKSFIEKNFYKNGASIVISGVRFTIYCKTENVRYLKIDKT